MQMFGRYRLLKRIAEGGMGEIFLARSASIDGFEKDLVIKRILPELGANERFTSLFIDEARVSISLSHQNLVQVFDFGQADGCYYIAMEHVYGCDLTRVLDLPENLDRGLPPGLSLYIMREALRGLHYAHNLTGRSGEPLNLVHRDISPDNIIISFEGGVKVTDFGISKAKGQLTKLEDGLVVGKWPYMAPEHALGKDTDAQSDVFSCGLVLWELLTGTPAYQGELTRTLHRRICEADLERPSKFNKDVHRSVDRVVMKALSKDKSERYPDARAFGAEINELLGKRYPKSDSYELQAYLEQRRSELMVPSFADVEDPGPPPAVRPSSADARTEPVPRPVKAEPAVEDTLPSRHREDVASDGLGERARTVASPPPEFDLDERVLRIAADFRKEPSLWHIVMIGDRCYEVGQPASAMAAYRVAAVKFAQHGLFAQSLLCAKRMFGIDGSEGTSHEVARLVGIAGRSDAHTLPYLFRSVGKVPDLLSELVTETLRKQRVSNDAQPLLRELDGEAFAQLARIGPQLQFGPEQPIVRQGDPGATMYVVLAGRTVVYVSRPNGERIYLASMMAGDFFGENSFFTGVPRSATVEAVEPTVLLEIDRALYERVMEGNPRASSILLEFYKDRVADSLLATSPTFGLLTAPQRRWLLGRLSLCAFAEGQPVMREGDPSDEIFIIKDGSARVYRGPESSRQMLREVGAGTIIGETGAVTGTRRTATVVAGARCEALRLPRADFLSVLDSAPELKARIEEVVRRNLEDSVAP